MRSVAKRGNGYTALSEAAMAGHTIVVGQLLRCEALDPRGENGGKKAPSESPVVPPRWERWNFGASQWHQNTERVYTHLGVQCG